MSPPKDDLLNKLWLVCDYVLNDQSRVPRAVAEFNAKELRHRMRKRDERLDSRLDELIEAAHP